jgi:hypothetical protein
MKEEHQAALFLFSSLLISKQSSDVGRGERLEMGGEGGLRGVLVPESGTVDDRFNDQHINEREWISININLTK